MRILIYSPGALAGRFGTPSAVRDWCDALVETGCDVVLVADANAPVAAEPRRARTLRIRHRLNGSKDGRFRIPVAIPRLVRASDVMVVHGAWQPAGLVAARTAVAQHVPYIITPHGLYDPHIAARQRRARQVWWRVAERGHVQRAAAIHWFFRDEARFFDISTREIVAPNGLAPHDVRWDGGSSGSIVWIGRFDPQHKGLDLLIDAVGCLPTHERPSIRLFGYDWLGKRRSVERLIDERGLRAWIRVDGPVTGDRKWQTLATARGFIYPSRWEAFGLSVLEALSVGVPTLVTAFPLGRFASERGAAVMGKADASSLADMLRSLSIADFDPAAGPALVRDHFRWDAVAADWKQQVSGIIEHGVRRATRES